MSKQRPALALQSKVSLTLAALIAVFIIASWLVLDLLITPAFEELELKTAQSDLKRAEMALQSDLENLHTVASDWAYWDDIYRYVRGEYPGFQRSNLDGPTLATLDLGFMAIYALDGQQMWSQARLGDEFAEAAVLGIFTAGDPVANALTLHDEPASDTTGIVDTANGPAIVSSLPILKSDESGSSQGALIMGQFLDDQRLSRMRARTEVDMFWSFDTGHGTEAPMSTVPDTQFELGRDGIAGLKVMYDIVGRPYLNLHSRTPRETSLLGGQTVGVALLFLALSGALVTIFVWATLHVMILRPIETLAQHMHGIRESGDLSRRLGGTRNDEIGALARQFDDLTGEVHDARQALLDQSFKAGKADTAAEVLHNIRNAMTPMINGLERIGRAFRATGKLRVEEAVEQLGDVSTPDDRKLKLLQYIDASFKHVADMGDDADEDLRIATAQARQIEGILADQEKYANVVPIAENLKMDDVVGEAVHVIPKNAQSRVDVEMPSTLGSYMVEAHRIGLLQVLSNLILNAYESIQRRQEPDGQIHFEVGSAMLEDTDMVCLTIRDNGAGFDEETGDRIFQRGFTSKTEGETTGLGLHWCANAVAGMGGRIRAESKGLGKGAEFHVLLPAAQGG
ncbi:MAG: CHASE4 domain-containing protein [Woeseiaceae bacterium]|nr:CHASE4 domain-containing protein [Woeseiaceae bacterium]